MSLSGNDANDIDEDANAPRPRCPEAPVRAIEVAEALTTGMLEGAMHGSSREAEDRALDAIGGRPALDSTMTRFELPYGVSVAAIAEVAALVGDPARLNMMLALMDGFPMNASDLADRAGVTPQTASSHIGKLKAAGLLKVEKRGRHHLHSLTANSAVSMLTTMAQVAVEGARSHRADYPRCPDAGIGLARVCNGHLAGRLAIALAGRLLDQQTGSLTDHGQAMLRAWGVDAPATHVVPGCFDWSERSEHIAAGLGCSILARGMELNWIKRIPGRRTLLITGIGMRGFQSHFGIAPPE